MESWSARGQRGGRDRATWAPVRAGGWWHLHGAKDGASHAGGNALMATVVVIDDTPEVTAVLDDVFERAGHRVVRVRNGGDGIEACQRVRPDLVLLDLQLPDMSG